MINRPKRHRLASLVALSMTLAVASSANAQDRQYQDRQNQDQQYQDRQNRDQQYQDRQNQERQRNAAMSLQINFGRSPHWSNVPGTRVRAIRQGDQTDYDMFRYGRNYYVYNNNNERWYGSRRWRGDFMLLDDRSVPRELRRIPRNNWRNYPASWEDRDYRNRDYRDSNYPDRSYPDRSYQNGSNGDRTYQNGYQQRSGGTSGTLQITFGSSPHWAGVSGTRVEAIPVAERTNYDVFRYGGNYYAYDNDQWYMSPRESGSFVVIDDRSVPPELSRVPRENWRNYPTAWGTRRSGGTSGSLQITFGSSPHWAAVGGTRVEAIPVAERTNYDVFRYGGNYYAYDNDQWYMSPRESGSFVMIDARSVPPELSRVPRENWRNYPTAWGTQDRGYGHGHN